MSYKVLYRKWRPLLFSEVCGQEHIITTLKNELTKNILAHAFIFSGTRGTGKTTVAKILSRAVNCLNSQNGEPCNKCDACKTIMDGTTTDVIEIDAASNNKVDNIREILDEISYKPMLLKNKVYIIDEVHMLSTGAFNALLKTLEEPPQNVIFILATTEPNKIPITIQSRCQRFDFHRVSVPELINVLKKICKTEKINIEDSALNVIANMCKGSVRDALSLLEKIKNNQVDKIIDANSVYEILGIPTFNAVEQIFQLLLSQNVPELIKFVNQLYGSGNDVIEIMNQILHYCRDLLIFKESNGSNENLDQFASKIDVDTLLKFTDLLYEALMISKYNDNSLFVLETIIIKMVSLVKKKNKSDDISNNQQNNNNNNSDEQLIQMDKEEWLKALEEIGNLDISLKNKFLTSTPMVSKSTVYIDLPEVFKSDVLSDTEKLKLLTSIFKKDVIILSSFELKSLIDSRVSNKELDNGSRLDEIIAQKDKLSGRMHIH